MLPEAMLLAYHAQVWTGGLVTHDITEPFNTIGSRFNSTDELVDSVLGGNFAIMAPAGDGLMTENEGVKRRRLTGGGGQSHARRLSDLPLIPPSSPPSPPPQNVSSPSLILGFSLLTPSSEDARNLSLALMALTDADFSAALAPALSKIASSLSTTLSASNNASIIVPSLTPTLLRATVKVQKLPYSRTFFFSALAYLRKNIFTVLASAIGLMLATLCCVGWFVWARRRKQKNKKFLHPRNAFALGKASAAVYPVELDYLASTTKKRKKLMDLEASVLAKVGSMDGWTSDEGGGSVSSIEGRGDPVGEEYLLHSTSSAGVLKSRNTEGTLPGSVDGDSSLDERATTEGERSGASSWEDNAPPVNPSLPPSAKGLTMLPAGGSVFAGKKRFKKPTQRPPPASEHEIGGLEFDDEEQVAARLKESLEAASKVRNRMGTGSKLRGAGRKFLGGMDGGNARVIPRLRPAADTLENDS